MPINTANILQIKYSAKKMFLYIAASIALIILFERYNFSNLPSELYNKIYYTIIGIPLLLIICFIIIPTLLKFKNIGQSVVTLSPDGIKDERLTNVMIPWRSIRSISSKGMQPQKLLVIDIDPDTMARLPLRRIAQLKHGWSRLFGIRGLSLMTLDLNIDFNEFSRQVDAYWKDYSGV